MMNERKIDDNELAARFYPNDPLNAGHQATESDPTAPAAPKIERDDAAATLYGHDPLDAARTLRINPEQMMPDMAGQLTIDIPDARLATATETELASIDAAKTAFFDADLNQSVLDSIAGDFWRHAETPVTTSREEAIAALRRHYGTETEDRLAMANELVRRAAASWPGIYDALEAYGSGNDPALIAKVIARAEVLKRAGRF